MPVFRSGGSFTIYQPFDAAATDFPLISPTPGMQLHVDSVYFSGYQSIVTLKLGGETVYTTQIPATPGFQLQDGHFTSPLTAPGDLTVTVTGFSRLTVTGREGTPVGANQVANPSFESFTDSFPDMWNNDDGFGSNPAAVRVATGGPAGERHLLLGRTQGFPEYTMTAAVYQVIGPLSTQQPFLLNLWSVGFNVLGGFGPSELNAGARVYASDATGKQGSLIASLTFPPLGSLIWLPLSYWFENLPSQYIRLQLYKAGNGFIRFDDVRLEAQSLEWA